MKSRTMRITSALLCLILLCAMTVPAVFAAVESEEFIPCPAGGRHQMHAIGAGYMYKGPSNNPGPIICYGKAYQCPGCYLVIGTQNYMAGPSFPGYAGHWCLWNAIQPEEEVFFYGCYMGYNTNFLDELILVSCDWW